MNHSIRHLLSNSQWIHQHAAWRPLHTCELGQSCRGAVVRLSLSRAEAARLWNKVIRSKWLSCTATSCDFKMHKCIQMTQLVLQRWQSITITTKSLESIRARRLPHQCPQTSAKFGGTLPRWALPKYTVHFPLRVREPQPASHKPCSWMLLGEKEMQRREEQLLQDYTQGHGKYGAWASCPLRYSICLHLISPKDPMNEFETFQCQHVVTTYHSWSKDTAPAWPALPKLSCKNTARQHGQFLFSRSFPHTVHDFISRATSATTVFSGWPRSFFLDHNFVYVRVKTSALRSMVGCFTLVLTAG